MLFHHGKPVPVSHYGEGSDAGSDDEPPPLPDTAPPPLNWDNFPGQAPAPAPAPAVTQARQPAETPPQGARLLDLKKRADFLGVSVEDSEEYHKVVEGQ